jgi:ABC-2 type transport system ATP-binding protein
MSGQTTREPVEQLRGADSAAICIRGLTKRYGSTAALAGLDLDVAEGETFGFLGPNGAGKSTTIELLLGVRRATSGSASIFGLDVWRDALDVHRRLGYVPSEADLWPSLTGGEVLRFLANMHGSVDEAYEAELVGRFELDLGKKCRAYSHGNRQKVLLIAAFASRAELLLLDEPTTGLDPLMEQVFRECVREAHDRGQTVFLSSHIMSEVEAVCDRVAMLQAGRVVEVGELETLRGMAALRVRAHLARPVPQLAEQLSKLEGVGRVVVDGTSIECDVTGPMDSLMGLLTPAGVLRLTTREPSLEELFVSRYGNAEPAVHA